MLLSLLQLVLSHWRLILAAVVATGVIDLFSGTRVRVPAQFRHKELLGKLRSYEVAQLSVIVFVFLLCGAVHLQAWTFVWIASAIPVLRCHSKELMNAIAVLQAAGLRHSIAELGLKSAEEVRHFCGTVCSIAVILTMVCVAYTSLAYARHALHPLEVYCFQFRGVDCSGLLAEWAGPGNCAILAESNGTCKAYCESYNRTCVKASDDLGTGVCRPQHGAIYRQTMEENGCLQNWRTQLCACTGFQDAEPWQQLDASGASLPGDAAAVEEAAPAPLEDLPAWPPERPVRRPSWETEEAEDCFLRDAQYVPLDMPGQGRTLASSPEQCQRRCFRTMGCARFTWLPLRDDSFGRGACHLQEYRSTKEVVPGAIAGPSSCDDEQELAELLGHAPPPKPQRQPSKAQPTPPSQPAPQPPAPQAQTAPPRTQAMRQAERQQPEPLRMPGDEQLMAVEDSFQHISGIAQAWYAQETHWEKAVLPEGNPVSLLWVFGIFMALATSGLLERRRGGV